MKIHIEIWLAATSLHEKGRETFTAQQVATEVASLFQDQRPGVKTHINSHCNASSRKNAGVVHNYLVRTSRNEVRLYRAGDQVDPSRQGCSYYPEEADIPREYLPLYGKWVDRQDRPSGVPEGPPLKPGLNHLDFLKIHHALVQILDFIEGRRGSREGPAARIARLCGEARIPEEIGEFMHLVRKFRNKAIHEGYVPTRRERTVVEAAMAAVVEWAESQGWRERPPA